MARPLCIQYAGARYHVMSRGDRREAIFHDDADRETRIGQGNATFKSPRRWEAAAPWVLLPPDLAAFVLFFEPAHQRFEVFHHRASKDVFADSFFQNFAPVFGAAFFQDVVQPRVDFLVVGVIT